jgi:hypothetical protein
VAKAKSEIKALPVDRIRTDGDTQPRLKMHLPTIDEYAELYQERIIKEPPVVFEDAEKYYWLADGFHRLRAVQKLGGKSIKCKVFKGSRRDAMLYSLKANCSHGLRRTAKDNRMVIMRCLNDDELSRLEGKQLSVTTGVSLRTIERIKQELRGEKPEPASEHEEEVQPPLAVEPESKEESKPVPKPPPPVPKDEEGNEIPPELRNVFEFRDVFASLMNGLSDIKRRLGEIAEGPQGTFLRMDQLNKELSDVRAVVKFAKPHAVCPYCAGSNPDCGACKGNGFVNKPAWEMCDDELKGRQA